MLKYLLFVSFFVSIQFLHGQTNSRLMCGQHILLNESLKNPTFKAEYEASQLQLKKEATTLSSSRNKKRGTIYTIPLVFHVLHSGGSENISDAQIFSALTILNADYRLKNTENIFLNET